MDRTAIAASLVSTVSRLIPEGTLKNRLRASLLSFRTGLPREIMVRRGDCVVQVGMWRVGNLMRLARCVGPEGRIILVEVDRKIVEDRRRTLEAHSIHHVTMVNKGAWHEKGVHRLRLGSDPRSNQLEVDNVVLPRGDDFLNDEMVEVDTVDNILRDLGIDHVDYAEITVNGVELQVLEGMEQTLRKLPRLFVAGMMRERDSGRPLNERVAAHLAERGFCTKITSRGRDVGFGWGQIEGHVYAWREA